MKLIYDVQDRPKTGRVLVFAIQQLLAIMAATIAVPGVVNQVTGSHMTPSAALFGAGVGTIVYLLFTKFKSPVFLGSSFAFLGSMFAAFSGAFAMSNEELGFLGLIVGAIFAGLVYAVLALVVKLVGTKWIDKVMPAVVIGPTVAIIGLSLAGNAVGDAVRGAADNTAGDLKSYVGFFCAFVTLVVVIVCSTYGKKMAKLIPFIIGIGAGYVVALGFTLLGILFKVEALQVIDFTPFKELVADGVGIKTFFAVPQFSFLKGIEGIKNAIAGVKEASDPVLYKAQILTYFVSVLVAYVPVAFVVFAEHLADHKNLSSIIEKDLLEEPGLHRTLLGDGIGSMAGAFFGGCPNTTYGESIGCVAITGNASIVSIFAAACLAILVSFLAPFMAFLSSIPGCVMGGVCITLYGFIAVSGLKMIQKADLNDSCNLFTVSVILICGIGGLAFTFGKVSITSIATALIMGIIVNVILRWSQKKKAAPAEAEAAPVEEEPAPVEEKVEE